jgi:hypothetical protein
VFKALHDIGILSSIGVEQGEKLERPNEPIGIKDGLRELIALGIANRDVCNGSWE